MTRFLDALARVVIATCLAACAVTFILLVVYCWWAALAIGFVVLVAWSGWRIVDRSGRGL